MMTAVRVVVILVFLALMVADFMFRQRKKPWEENERLKSELRTLKEREVIKCVEDNKDGAVNGRVDGGESENQERL